MSEKGGRYFREARFFFLGDRVIAQSHVPEARALLGYLRDMHALGGPPIQVKYTTLPDGTEIKAVMMNGQYQAQILSVGKGGGVEDGYEVWVRPFGDYDYDWLVTDDPNSVYGVITRQETPRHYSNRMWQSGKDIHCVIGGGDDSRYFGSAGSQISVDGKIVYEGANIVGTAMFAGKRVVVTAALTYPGYEQAVFTVAVEGYTYTTPALSSVTYGYLRADNTKRFSQNTVIFNSSGSEGSCVLGDTSVLTFHLSLDAGNVLCTHTITEIPGTDATVAVARIPTGIIGNIQTESGCTKTTAYKDDYTLTTGRQYTVAFACDYSPDDVLVFGLLRYDNTYRFTVTSDLEDAFSYSSCLSGATAYSRTKSGVEVQTKYESISAAGSPGIDCTIVSTLHGDMTRLREGDETVTQNGYVGGYVAQITRYMLGVINAIDLRYGFVLTRGPEPLLVSKTAALVSDNGDGTGTVQVTTVSEKQDIQFNAHFIGGVDATANIADELGGTATEPPVPADGLPYNLGGSCAACGWSSTVDNTNPATMGPSDPAVPVRTVARPRLFFVDQLPGYVRSYGFVYPGKGEEWSQALAFFSPDTGPLIVHSVHRGGGQDVTAQFNAGARVGSNPTTNHFGVIHTKKENI